MPDFPQGIGDMRSNHRNQEQNNHDAPKMSGRIKHSVFSPEPCAENHQVCFVCGAFPSIKIVEQAGSLLPEQNREIVCLFSGDALYVE